jgi:hypothetical protein
LNDQDVLNLAPDSFVNATQYTQSTITLELTGAFIGEGQLVSLVGEMWIGTVKGGFEAIAKVVSAEVIDGPHVQFEFQLKQFQKNQWHNFLESKKSAQEHVDNLLKKMKGN